MKKRLQVLLLQNFEKKKKKKKKKGEPNNFMFNPPIYADSRIAGE